MNNTMMYERKLPSIIKEFLADRESTLKAYATGNSMNPVIKEGDILVIKPITSKEARIGDILVFEAGERLCCHRLIMKYFRNSSYLFVTKPDRAFLADELFDEKKLAGKVSRIQKGAITLNLESIFWTLINRFLGLYHLTTLSVRNRLKPLKPCLFKKTSRCRI